MTNRQLVLNAVLKLGECSVSQVVAEVGGKISPAVAMMNSRRDARRRKKGGKFTSPMVSGLRLMVSDVLCQLCKKGSIRRVGKGVYAPPLPRIADCG